MKTFTIKDGVVCEVSPLGRGMNNPEIQAANKTEATAQFLRMAKQVLAGSPRLYWRNGAMLLTFPNGSGWTAEAATPARASQLSGWVLPLCSGNYDTEADAMKGASFAYYSSDEYQKQAALDRAP